MRMANPRFADLTGWRATRASGRRKPTLRDLEMQQENAALAKRLMSATGQQPSETDPSPNEYATLWNYGARGSLEKARPL